MEGGGQGQPPRHPATASGALDTPRSDVGSEVGSSVGGDGCGGGGGGGSTSALPPSRIRLARTSSTWSATFDKPGWGSPQAMSGREQQQQQQQQPDPAFPMLSSSQTDIPIDPSTPPTAARPRGDVGGALSIDVGGGGAGGVDGRSTPSTGSPLGVTPFAAGGDVALVSPVDSDALCSPRSLDSCDTGYEGRVGAGGGRVSGASTPSPRRVRFSEGGGDGLALGLPPTAGGGARARVSGGTLVSMAGASKRGSQAVLTPQGGAGGVAAVSSSSRAVIDEKKRSMRHDNPALRLKYLYDDALDGLREAHQRIKDCLKPGLTAEEYLRELRHIDHRLLGLQATYDDPTNRKVVDIVVHFQEKLEKKYVNVQGAVLEGASKIAALEEEVRVADARAAALEQEITELRSGTTVEAVDVEEAEASVCVTAALDSEDALWCLFTAESPTFAAECAERWLCKATELLRACGGCTTRGTAVFHGAAVTGVFADAAAALEWCRRLTDALLEIDWPESLNTTFLSPYTLTPNPAEPEKKLFNGVGVKFGIDVGTVVKRDCRGEGSELLVGYLGLPVTRSKRAADDALNGEVLLTPAAVDNMKDALKAAPAELFPVSKDCGRALLSSSCLGKEETYTVLYFDGFAERRNYVADIERRAKLENVKGKKAFWGGLAETGAMNEIERWKGLYYKEQVKVVKVEGEAKLLAERLEDTEALNKVLNGEVADLRQQQQQPQGGMQRRSNPSLVSLRNRSSPDAHDARAPTADATPAAAGGFRTRSARRATAAGPSFVGRSPNAAAARNRGSLNQAGKAVQQTSRTANAFRASLESPPGVGAGAPRSFRPASAAATASTRAGATSAGSGQRTSECGDAASNASPARSRDAAAQLDAVSQASAAGDMPAWGEEVASDGPESPESTANTRARLEQRQHTWSPRSPAPGAPPSTSPTRTPHVLSSPSEVALPLSDSDPLGTLSESFHTEGTGGGSGGGLSGVHGPRGGLRSALASPKHTAAGDQFALTSDSLSISMCLSDEGGGGGGVSPDARAARSSGPVGFADSFEVSWAGEDIATNRAYRESGACRALGARRQSRLVAPQTSQHHMRASPRSMRLANEEKARRQSLAPALMMDVPQTVGTSTQDDVAFLRAQPGGWTWGGFGDDSAVQATVETRSIGVAVDRSMFLLSDPTAGMRALDMVGVARGDKVLTELVSVSAFEKPLLTATKRRGMAKVRTLGVQVDTSGMTRLVGATVTTAVSRELCSCERRRLEGKDADAKVAALQEREAWLTAKLEEHFETLRVSQHRVRTLETELVLAHQATLRAQQGGSPRGTTRPSQLAEFLRHTPAALAFDASATATHPAGVSAASPSATTGFPATPLPLVRASVASLPPPALAFMGDAGAGAGDVDAAQSIDGREGGLGDGASRRPSAHSGGGAASARPSIASPDAATPSGSPRGRESGGGRAALRRGNAASSPAAASSTAPEPYSEYPAKEIMATVLDDAAALARLCGQSVRRLHQFGPGFLFAPRDVQMLRAETLRDLCTLVGEQRSRKYHIDHGDGGVVLPPAAADDDAGGWNSTDASSMPGDGRTKTRGPFDDYGGLRFVQDLLAASPQSAQAVVVQQILSLWDAVYEFAHAFARHLALPGAGIAGVLTQAAPAPQQSRRLKGILGRYHWFTEVLDADAAKKAQWNSAKQAGVFALPAAEARAASVTSMRGVQALRDNSGIVSTSTSTSVVRQ